MKCEKKIKVDFNSNSSIKNSERTKRSLENKGFNLKKTSQIGLNKFVLTYKKC